MGFVSPQKRKFTKRHVYANDIDEIWEEDPVERRKFKRCNDAVDVLVDGQTYFRDLAG